MGPDVRRDDRPRTGEQLTPKFIGPLLASDRHAAHGWRPFHDDEARSLQMLQRSATILANISPQSRTCFRPL
jgi:hypothetical protein